MKRFLFGCGQGFATLAIIGIVIALLEILSRAFGWSGAVFGAAALLVLVFVFRNVWSDPND